jgi:hypothetical protein
MTGVIGALVFLSLAGWIRWSMFGGAQSFQEVSPSAAPARSAARATASSASHRPQRLLNARPRSGTCAR